MQYSVRYINFGRMGDLCKMITWLGLAIGQSLNPTERRPISQHNYLYNYRCQQILTLQYIKMSVNRASATFDVVSWAIRLLIRCRKS